LTAFLAFASRVGKFATLIADRFIAAASTSMVIRSNGCRKSGKLDAHLALLRRAHQHLARVFRLLDLRGARRPYIWIRLAARSM
jgi:hypothetical protein